MKEGLFARTGLAIILLTAACSTAFGYNQQNDKPIWQVAFTVAGNISADMQSVYFNVSPVGGSNYYFSNYEILGIDEEDSAKARVKLRFVGNDKHYFRITKASQIRTPRGIEYVSARRENEAYALEVIVKAPVGGEFLAAEIDPSWTQIGDNWIYTLPGGLLATGWQFIDGEWYYFRSSGLMSASQWIDNTYYVDSQGHMLRNTITPDGYKVGSDGKWINETTPSSNAGTRSGSGASNSTGNGIYYWTESGKSYHVSPNCRTLKRSKKIYSGSTIPSDKRDPCNVCVR